MMGKEIQLIPYLQKSRAHFFVVAVSFCLCILTPHPSLGHLNII